MAKKKFGKKLNFEAENIRGSQFILTYGPGAIIESKKGSRIIPDFMYGLNDYHSKDNFEKFEIRDVRLSNALKASTDAKVKIFALPTNSSFKGTKQGIYHTYKFPVWKVCYGKGKHSPILYNSFKKSEESNCPKCSENVTSNIRFVAACPDGHLDEVNWYDAVHKNSTKTCVGRDKVDYFYWNAKGSSLSSIVVKCPKCGASTDMGQIYRNRFDCSGRMPESEMPLPADSSYGVHHTFPIRDFKKCKHKMKVIQRQSASLRMVETATLLTIPEYDDNISRLLQDPELYAAIIQHVDYKDLLPADSFIENFYRGLTRSKLPEPTINEIIEYVEGYDNKVEGYEKLLETASKLYKEDLEIKDLIYEEFDSLRDKKVNDTKHFRKGLFEKFKFPLSDNLTICVAPIYTVRTVTVQTGYMRIPYRKKDDEAHKISDSYTRPDEFDRTIWYPGFEGIGEAIFITSDDNPLNTVSKDILDMWNGLKNKGDDDRWRGNVVKEPQFKWWHTLSHAIIRILSTISGYSSASLRERVYTDKDNERGGILIYTTSAGEDCGMGGLVESVKQFDKILDYAIKSIEICSNDPLCFETKSSMNGINGSACHSCLMISETSCEHGNKWLDRHILLND